MSKQNSPSQITDMILVHYYMTYKGSNSATLDCTRFYKNKQAAYSDIKGAFHNWMGKMNRLTVEVGIPYFTDGGFLVLDYEKSLAFGLNTVRPWNDRTGRKLIFALAA